jgi:uncharacterized oligopeptide transporter (OPT) family protein
MQLLYEVYGIGGVVPHPGMDASLSLPAPPAAVMATLTEAVFQQTIPWNMLLLGGIFVVIFSFFNIILKAHNFSFSVLGVAMGIYLPLSSSMSLFVGGLIAWTIQNKKRNMHRDIMLACGLIAGSAMMDVLLAIPFAMLHNPDIMNLAPPFWKPIAIGLSIIVTYTLYLWFKRLVKQ